MYDGVRNEGATNGVFWCRVGCNVFCFNGDVFWWETSNPRFADMRGGVVVGGAVLPYMTVEPPIVFPNEQELRRVGRAIKNGVDVDPVGTAVVSLMEQMGALEQSSCSTPLDFGEKTFYDSPTSFVDDVKLVEQPNMTSGGSHGRVFSSDDVEVVRGLLCTHEDLRRLMNFINVHAPWVKKVTKNEDFLTMLYHVEEAVQGRQPSDFGVPNPSNGGRWLQKESRRLGALTPIGLAHVLTRPVLSNYSLTFGVPFGGYTESCVPQPLGLTTATSIKVLCRRVFGAYSKELTPVLVNVFSKSLFCGTDLTLFTVLHGMPPHLIVKCAPYIKEDLPTAFRGIPVYYVEDEDYCVRVKQPEWFSRLPHNRKARLIKDNISLLWECFRLSDEGATINSKILSSWNVARVHTELVNSILGLGNIPDYIVGQLPMNPDMYEELAHDTEIVRNVDNGDNVGNVPNAHNGDIVAGGDRDYSINDVQHVYISDDVAGETFTAGARKLEFSNITTTRRLVYVGGIMNICVGGASYRKRLTAGDSLFFVGVTAKSKKPKIVVETTPSGEIIEIRGVNNNEINVEDVNTIQKRIMETYHLAKQKQENGVGVFG